MTVEGLSAIVGIVLSLLFSYVPGLNTWFAALSGEVKRLIMLALTIVCGAAIYGLSCAGLGDALGIGVTCNFQGFVQLLTVVIAVIVANQSMFAISPQLLSVRTAKGQG